MCVCARLLLLAALPALAGRAGCEVVSVTESGGVGPAFAPRQRLAAVAAVGQDATLECRVLRLGDKAVSWVRSRDLQILTHAGAVFTADARVSAAESRAAAVASGAGSGADGGAAGRAGSRHSLHIQRLRVADGGRYECQVNTDPKMSLFFNLTVVDEPVPQVVVAVLGPREVHAAAGGAATLACEARYSPPPRLLPLPPLDVRWRRAGDPAALSLQRPHGGVSLDTQRWAARTESRLTLAELTPRDAATYECAAHGTSATARLLLDDNGEEHMEMQRDQSASAAARCRDPSWLLPLSLSSLSALLSILLRN